MKSHDDMIYGVYFTGWPFCASAEAERRWEAERVSHVVDWGPIDLLPLKTIVLRHHLKILLGSIPLLLISIHFEPRLLDSLKSIAPIVSDGMDWGRSNPAECDKFEFVAHAHLREPVAAMPYLRNCTMLFARPFSQLISSLMHSLLHRLQCILLSIILSSSGESMYVGLSDNREAP